MKYGKISESVLKRSVLKQIHTRRDEVINGAGIGEDCAILAWEKDQELLFTIDPVVVSGKNQESFAIFAAANNLAAKGAETVGVLISILLPETVYESDLKEMMQAMEKTCEHLQLQILGGHTEVSPAVNRPIITVTGVGKATSNQHALTKGAMPGQDIVISKWIAMEATVRIAEEKEAVLKEKYAVPFMEQAKALKEHFSIIPEAATAMKSGVRTMHDLGRGGIFGALWELAEASGVGLTVDLKKIPVKQETIEVCEVVDVNPYQAASMGSLLMVTDQGYDLVRNLEKEGIPAVVIGKITEGNDRTVINEDETRFLEPPKADENNKI